MIKRLAIRVVKELAEQFPAVLILGPRQCGKTTLARNFLRGEYFDLEKPSDQQVFLGDIELALRRMPEPLIIDEAQTLPRLFPVLRALIDEERRKCGRFYLLGSVDPALIRNLSESLAGRVGILELTPFLFPETAGLGIDLPGFWVRGGYPDACLAKTETGWQRWQENYLRTFVERDIPRQGVRVSPIMIRRLMGMIAHYHGGLLNASELGRSLGVSYHTANHYLDLLEGHYLIRRLPPYYANVGKRIVKSPKVYLRDSGLLHYLLGVSSERSLLETPQRGRSWEGFMIEQLIALELLKFSAARFYFYRTYAGAEIDLVIERGELRTGYEFKCALSVTPRDWSNLKAGIADGVIDRGVVVYPGERNYPVAGEIEVAPAGEILRFG